jgi:hypothetical protein
VVEHLELPQYGGEKKKKDYQTEIIACLNSENTMYENICDVT